jgi:hypothetical protein
MGNPAFFRLKTGRSFQGKKSQVLGIGLRGYEMIDVDAAIKAYLSSKAGIIAVFGARIYAARFLPAGYQPVQGPACLFLPRGGSQDYSSQVAIPSVQFRIYAASEGLVRTAAAAIYDGVNDTKGLGIAWARMDDGTFPVMLTEPDTNWPYMLMYIVFFVVKKGV